MNTVGMEQLFMQHIAEWGLHYGTLAEFNFRLERFAETENFIREFNSSPKSFEIGHNKLSTMSEEEKGRLMNMQPPTEMTQEPVMLDESMNGYYVNWKDQGKVNPIKDQSQCGSCWAFSATTVMESRDAIKNNRMLRLSEQQLVSCDMSNGGCEGGWMDKAWNYLKTKSHSQESQYPYTSKNGQRGACRHDKEVGPTYVTGVHKIKKYDPNQMKAAVNAGPISVTVDASGVFGSYKNGIINQGCGTKMNHAVAIIGYGNENGQEFWLVRNSWDTWWGDQGYVKVAITGGIGTCAINEYPMYPDTA